MQRFKKILPFILVVILAAAPAGAAAAPMTWQAVLDEYPSHQIQPFVMSLNQTNTLLWGSVIAQLAGGTDITLGVYAADGLRINTGGNNVRLCTGQHASVVVTSDTRRANLFEVIIRGDVIGNGMLTIAQITRLAGAITGAQPLSGPYYLAGDVDGNGEINIVDLVLLCNWLTGRL